MKFQIKNIEIDGTCIELSQTSTSGNENVFSMLVGRNAVGKTRTLSKIVNSYVFHNQSTDVFETSDSIKNPSRIIAVSNSKFDRFPDPAGQSGRRHSSFHEGYHYFGLGSFRAGIGRTLSKAFETLLGRAVDRSGHGQDLAIMLDYVGFLPLLQVEFRRPYRRVASTRSLTDSLSDRFYDEYERAKSILSPESIVFDFDFESCILPALQYFEHRETSGKGLSLRMDLAHEFWIDAEILEYCQFGAILLQAGLIKISKLTLFDKRTKDKLPFHLASSGQQCMLLMFMGMMGVITDYSLICIDEPEISLHPKWQTEFIGILQGAFTSVKGCHFIIATHSPQIIAGLVSQNGFVIDLENSLLVHSSLYARKSADFQLTEVFHEPGFKNEYLIRILLVLLSKVSAQQQLTSADRAKLHHIESVRERLDENDPVLHLLNQVKMLAE